ncbi:hypothetical protein [Methylovirgula sp. HY1]|uniref:hypothetical protein n=1 Tax=Methylovirgula sp. HY1 TaxID=2822761 RepID=UPI001C5A6A1D|nr:hypothetical protein [Methylovirgula sp. HY1]QXX74211.1 hypothetical protein MHY1_01021 [Methylovirgula sp. HY1]
MPKYRKKPVVIDAVQFNGKNTQAIMIWAAGSTVVIRSGTPDCLTVATPEGDMLASLGDWIIRGVKGEFYPCKPDIFEATYEAA